MIARKMLCELSLSDSSEISPSIHLRVFPRDDLQNSGHLNSSTYRIAGRRFLVYIPRECNRHESADCRR